MKLCSPLTKTDLEIALKEYELATQHYFHEDKMKTDALKNSFIVFATILTVVTAIIFNPQSKEYYTKEPIIKIWLFVIGLAGFLISFSYGLQYIRILKYQEAREARLEELEKIIEEGKFFALQTIRYGSYLMKNKKLNVSFKSLSVSGLACWSSSNVFKIVIIVIILIWFIFLILLLHDFRTNSILQLIKLDNI